MNLGKAITLFLIDAVPTGRIAAELYNWTGKAYKIPRKLLKDSSNRPDLHKAGIYLLFGRDETDPELHNVYVGEAEEVHKRLTQQLEKDFWNEAVVFISKDENLNKAHVKFLEFHVYDAIKQVKRSNLENGNTPACPVISELEQSVMLEFLQNLKLLVSTLGYRIFEPLAVPRNEDLTIYAIKGARGANAEAAITNEGIVVREGSHAAMDVVPSASDWVTNTRKNLLDSGVLIYQGEKLLFTRDHVFSSPSTAAAIVMGRNANGLTEWKDLKGRTLKENEES